MCDALEMSDVNDPPRSLNVDRSLNVRLVFLRLERI
jgi:hypothetical protein